jgi:hypothetical protein
MEAAKFARPSKSVRAYEVMSEKRPHPESMAPDQIHGPRSEDSDNSLDASPATPTPVNRSPSPTSPACVRRACGARPI